MVARVRVAFTEEAGEDHTMPTVAPPGPILVAGLPWPRAPVCVLGGRRFGAVRASAFGSRLLLPFLACQSGVPAQPWHHLTGRRFGGGGVRE
eukprot:5522162-Pyramimonas_sp.AAC.1